jgi:hypothetical protein
MHHAACPFDTLIIRLLSGINQVFYGWDNDEDRNVGIKKGSF